MTVNMRTKNIDSLHHRTMIETFSSANELVSITKARKFNPNGGFDSDTFSGQRDGDGSWQGCKTMKEAVGLLQNGWAENVEVLKNKMNGTKQKVDGKRMTFKNDVVGYTPIVPLAIMGIPNSMLNSHQRPIKTKIIDLYYDTTVSCGNSPKQILNNGMKIVETVINLEQSGYRVRLSAMQSYSNRETSDTLIVGVKSENQPLDIKRIMFPLMHPAMFRMIGFGWYERCPTATHRSGYGRALSYTFTEKQMQDFIEKAFGKTAIYISGTFIQEKSQEHIENQLKGETRNVK